MQGYAVAALGGPRWQALSSTIRFVGADLTGADFRLQVRLLPNTPGEPLVDLAKVGTAAAEGVRLISVETIDGQPVSTIGIRVNETTMEGLPFAGEMGSSTVLAWDMQVTPSGGLKQKWIGGDFIVESGVTGADNATLASEPYGRGAAQASAPSGLQTFQVGETIISVTLAGGEGPPGKSSGPLGAGSVGAVEMSDDPSDLAAVTDKLQYRAPYDGAVNRPLVEKNAEVLSVADFADPGASATVAQSLHADVFLPAGDFTGDVPDTSDAVIEGDGRLFNSAGVQTSTYAEPRSRSVIGQEYLWGFLYRAKNGLLSSTTPIVFAGDSTTRGAFAQGAGGSLPETDKVHRLNDDQMVRYGIYGPASVNSGSDGITTREWLNGFTVSGQARGLDYDMATYPAMSIYVVRFGINDGSLIPTYHDIQAYRRDIRAGLQRLRAAKSVNDLSIVLMAPNSVSETGARDEAWMEQVTRVLKKAARDYQCCYIDTYALWRDARAQAIGAWRDNVGGAGIHPDGVANRLIMSVFGEVVYKPISTRGIATNVLLNAPGSATRPVTVATAPNDPLFAAGDCTYRTDTGNTFPLNGIVRTFKSADGIMTQENTGFQNENSRRTYTRYGLDGGTWSDWRGLDYEVPLASGWTSYDAGTPPLAVNKSRDGTVLLHGRVKNSGATAGSVMGTLPVGYRPLIVKFLSTGNGTDATRGQISISSSGAITWLSGMPGDVIIDITFRAFG